MSARFNNGEKSGSRDEGGRFQAGYNQPGPGRPHGCRYPARRSRDRGAGQSALPCGAPGWRAELLHHHRFGAAMIRLRCRLDRLEQEIRPEAAPLFVLLNPGETEAGAVRREFPDGPPAARPIRFVTWLPSA